MNDPVNALVRLPVAMLLVLLPVACGASDSSEARQPESLGLVSRPAQAAELSTTLTETPPELDTGDVDAHLTLGLSAERVEGDISRPRETRRYSFTVDHQRLVRVYVEGDGLDPTLEITDDSGRRVAFDNDSGEGRDARIRMQLEEGPYIIVVRGNRRSSGRFYLTLR